MELLCTMMPACHGFGWKLPEMLKVIVLQKLQQKLLTTE
jgi:hypothetical protein